MNTSAPPLTQTIKPADQAAVARAVREACANGTPVYPIGGGTNVAWNGPQQQPGIGLSLESLDRVIDYPADDMTITVEAGMTIAELNRRLAVKGQRLPVDVAHPQRATVGGAVVSHTAGPRRFACGTLRDYLLGFKAVDGRGTPFSGGGRVVKNAAGYDMCRLMVGSRGTLAVVTQVTLMVRPLLEASAFVVRDLPDLDQAERLLADLVHTETLPAAVELRVGPTRQNNPVIGPMLESHVARLFVAFESDAAEVEWMVAKIQEEWKQADVGVNGAADAASVVTVASKETEPLWRWLCEFPAEARIHVRPSRTVAMMERLVALDVGCALLAHAGNGIIRVCFSPQEPGPFAAMLNDDLWPAVEAAGGHMAVRTCPGESVWQQPGDGAKIMQEIKNKFDPGGILNPGALETAQAAKP